jgi:hypothetical protein
VPDALIEHMSRASTAASDSVALALTAVQSSYTAEASLLQPQEMIERAAQVAVKLRDRLTAEPSRHQLKEQSDDSAMAEGEGGSKVYPLLQAAYKNAESAYKQALLNNAMVSQQLAYAEERLALAKVRLNSYSAGLAAATAASAA